MVRDTFLQLRRGDMSGIEIISLIYPHLGLRDEIYADARGNIFFKAEEYKNEDNY